MKEEIKRIRTVNIGQTNACQRGEGEVMGKMGEGEWEIQASSYGMKKSWK